LQVWAGNNWGALFIPRVGQEVVVDFMEGNYNYPVIVGSVYNSDNMSPGSLPGTKNISGFRSRSTEGGGEHNANVLTFDDTLGSEVFYMRAEKDMAVRVENNEDYHVMNNQTITVDQDRTETVTRGNESVTIQQGNRNVTISMGNDSLTVSTGNQTTTVSMGSISTSAMQSITLTVGPSSITIAPSGVTISAPMVTISANTIAQVSGEAMLDLSGGVTMINCG
jgi:type VI secretion system secreted protein VgrG